MGIRFYVLSAVVIAAIAVSLSNSHLPKVPVKDNSIVVEKADSVVVTNFRKNTREMKECL